MVRTQIQLTEEQSRTLKKTAQIKGVSIAELIRESIDHHLTNFASTSITERRDRALRACGCFRSGKRNLSTEHDRYLKDAYRT